MTSSVILAICLTIGAEVALLTANFRYFSTRRYPGVIVVSQLSKCVVLFLWVSISLSR